MACRRNHPLFLELLFLFFQENGVALLSTYKTNNCEKKKASAAAVEKIVNQARCRQHMFRPQAFFESHSSF